MKRYLFRSRQFPNDQATEVLARDRGAAWAKLSVLEKVTEGNLASYWYIQRVARLPAGRKRCLVCGDLFTEDELDHFNQDEMHRKRVVQFEVWNPKQRRYVEAR